MCGKMVTRIDAVVVSVYDVSIRISEVVSFVTVALMGVEVDNHNLFYSINFA